MANKKKILQIIPAQDWYAVFKDQGAGQPDAVVPLVCWALVEHEDGTRGVEGMEADDYVDFAEDVGNFSRYLHGSDIAGEDEQS